MTDSDSAAESSAATPQGPAYLCRNIDCEYLTPPTTVHESERKTVYRCPGCRRGLHIDWKEDEMNTLTCANPDCEDPLHADSDHVHVRAETKLMDDANDLDHYYFHMECWWDVADNWEGPA